MAYFTFSHLTLSRPPSLPSSLLSLPPQFYLQLSSPTLSPHIPPHCFPTPISTPPLFPPISSIGSPIRYRAPLANACTSFIVGLYFTNALLAAPSLVFLSVSSSIAGPSHLSPRPCSTRFDIHMHGPLLPSTTSTFLFSTTSSTTSEYLTPGLSPAEPLLTNTYTCGFRLATWRVSNGPT